MSKLLKQWKFFSLGLMVAVVGLLVASCAETEDEPTDNNKTTDIIVKLVGGGTDAFVSEFKGMDPSDYDDPSLGTNLTVKAGDTVVVYAGDKSGFNFKGWTGISGVDTLYTGYDNVLAIIVKSSSVTVTATWNEVSVAVPFAVTVAFGEVDLTTQPPTYTTLTGVTGSSGQGTYVKGESVIVRAGEKSGYVFVAWTSDTVSNIIDNTDPETNETLTFTMPEKAVALTAWFTVLPEGVYSVTVNSGSAEDPYYEEDDIVEITAATYPDSLFFKWTTTTNGVTFDNDTGATTTFTMPGRDVTVTATFVPKPPVVRFTWEAEQLPNIYLISASTDDVASWIQDVYNGIYLVNVQNIEGAQIDDYVSKVPLYTGSSQLPDNLYTNPGNLAHKGKYYAIDDGQYTAVATVYDTYGTTVDTFDLVANYTIDGEVEKPFFDIGFDVGLLVEHDPLGNPDTWVAQTSFDNPYTTPYLQKTQGKGAKLLKTLKKGNVTYYVLRRPRK